MTIIATVPVPSHLTLLEADTVEIRTDPTRAEQARQMPGRSVTWAEANEQLRRNPGFGTLDREDTRPIVTQAVGHPSWCMFRDYVGNDPCGGDHMSEPVNVPATAGGYVLIDDGAAFPRVEIHAITLNGQAHVALNLFTPMGGSDWTMLCLTAEDARILAGGLHSLKDGQAVRVPGNGDRSVWCALAGDSARLELVDYAQDRMVSVQMRVDELRQVAANLTTAAAVVTR